MSDKRGPRPGVGGAYEIDADGARVQVVPPTPDHPQGNRPRDAEGRPTDTPPQAAPIPGPAETKPAPEAAKSSAKRAPPPAFASGN